MKEAKGVGDVISNWATSEEGHILRIVNRSDIQRTAKGLAYVVLLPSSVLFPAREVLWLESELTRVE